MAKLLFVCLGNICRSPAAEAVMRQLMAQQNITEHQCDSAGTSGFHEGQSADQRMRQAAERRGITITHRARPITAQDLRDFDYVFVMDQSNAANVHRLARTPQEKAKIKMMAAFCRHHQAQDIPDPYYGGAHGFDLVLDLLTDAATEILRQLQTKTLA
ncbi:MAG: low molecular weight phosphotyrosine protein phosphatase [Bacteriovoracaceae bacterium]|nr:low molecular weight phosphotyrosine protein phosphatase [Bacteriovoracaceae bacterium]